MGNPPSALLVCNNQVAAGIITCSKEIGILIPDELAIIGFYDQPIAKLMNITTMDVPLADMGRKLFHQAIHNNNNNNNNIISHEEISFKLVERKSV